MRQLGAASNCNASRGDARTCAVEAETRQHVHAALRERAVIAAERANLRVAVRMRGHAPIAASRSGSAGSIRTPSPVI